MENNRMEQLDALMTLSNFNDRLLKNFPTIIDELSGNRQADTDSYFQTIIDAINWEIAVTNATLSLLNEDRVRIDKEAFNQKVISLSSAISSHSDEKIVNALQELIPFFKALGEAAKEVTA